MATIPTYERNPQAQQLGGTAKISVSGSPVAKAVGQLGGQIQQIGAQFVQKQQQLQDLGAASDYSVTKTKAFANAEQLWNQAMQAPDNTLTVEDKPQFITEEVEQSLGQYVQDIEASEQQKQRIQSDYQQSFAELEVGLQKEVSLRVAERNVVKTQQGIFDLISAGNIEEAQAMTKRLYPFITKEKADEFLQSAMDSATKNSVYQSMLLNPSDTLESLRKGEWNLSAEDRVKFINTAETQRNKIQTRNGDEIKSRLLGMIYAEGQEGDSFERLERDAQEQFEMGALSATAYESTMKKLENPLGTPSIMPAQEFSALLTEISEYSPNEDPKREQLSALWEKVAVIDNDRYYQQAKSLYELVEKGGVASTHWKDINKLIDGEMSGGIFGPDFATITSETGLLAKEEVANYLRENPTDREGAIKLYEGIKANDVQQLTKDFYRKKYGYGQPKFDSPSRAMFGLGEQPQRFGSVEAAEKANLPKGTKVIINGRTGIVR